MAKRVTLDDIASVVGVSKNTVSLALRNREGISDAVRARILRTAKELGYNTARSQTTPPNGNILVLYPERLAPLSEMSFHGTFSQLLICHMERYAKQLGYCTVPYTVSLEEEQLGIRPAVLDTIDFIGIVSKEITSPAYAQMLKKLELPTVVVEPAQMDTQFSTIELCNTQDAYRMTKYLISMGHTRIQYFGECKYLLALWERYSGYRLAMEEAGLAVLHNTYMDEAVTFQSNSEELQRIRAAWEACDPKPTAILCGDDHVAYRTIRVLEQLGVRIPQDVSICGLQDLDMYSGEEMRLTSCIHPIKEIAETAIHMVTDGQPASQRTIRFHSQPVYRDSVQRL